MEETQYVMAAEDIETDPAGSAMQLLHWMHGLRSREGFHRTLVIAVEFPPAHPSRGDRHRDLALTPRVQTWVGRLLWRLGVGCRRLLPWAPP